MITYLSPSRQAYCEMCVPEAYTSRKENALLLLNALLERDVLDSGHYFLYENANAETRIVANPFAFLRIDNEAVSLIVIETRETLQQRVSPDPLKQAEALLRQVPLLDAVAYGYISFDLVHSHFDYRQTVHDPLLLFLIPTLEIVLTLYCIRIRSLDPRIAQEVLTIWQQVQQQVLPPTPRATSLALVETDRAWYEEAVHTLIKGIYCDASSHGPFQKAILSRAVAVPRPLDMAETYALVQRVPTAHSYCFHLERDAAVCASLETLLEATDIRTRALTGTRPHGCSVEKDTALEQELRRSQEQLSKHFMSVYAVQDEHRSVCAAHSLRIQHLGAVQKYLAVQYLASRLLRQLATSKTAWDALRAVFPRITVSGIAKATDIAWIDSLDPSARGLYAEAIRRISTTETADFVIAIRTVFHRDGHATFHAGAGIISDSESC